MHATICRGVMSASSFQSGFRARLACRSHIGVDDRRHRDVDDALLRAEPAQLRVADASARQNAAGSAKISSSVAADDQRRERADRFGADLVAAADREREAVPLESPSVLQDDVRGGVVRILVHRIGAVGGQRRREPQVEDLEIA